MTGKEVLEKMTEEAVPLTPEQMKEMAEKDPNFKKKLVEQVRNMSDEDFMAAMDASGDAPEMTPAMLQVAKAQFLAMDDDELLLCMGLQDSTMDGRTEEDLMQKMQKNSAANAQALEAMGQMSEDEILQMSKMAGTMPGGQELDSAQLKEGIKAMEPRRTNRTILKRGVQGRSKGYQRRQRLLDLRRPRPPSLAMPEREGQSQSGR